MLDSSFFARNQQAPLEQVVLGERIQGSATIQDITYASPHSGKVAGYLIFPSNSPTEAGLLFGHWGEGNREEFVDEAIILTRLGFASLCLDAPYRRPAEYKPLEEPPMAEVQWIVDVRRGVDLLQDRFSLMPEQFGYIGHSYGATFGGAITCIEYRFKVHVLMAGWYAFSEIMRSSLHPLIVKDREATPPEEFKAYLDAMAPLDAIHYIGHAAPAHLLFQFAHNDEFVTEADGKRYFELASEPKRLAWYDNCGHELNAQARLDRVTWLCSTLSLALPSQEILDLLAQVPEPRPVEGWGK
jgi:hypothetical protein